ncbi:MAG: hypothetical protein ABI454_00015 [Sphingomicrobium sp.]
MTSVKRCWPARSPSLELLGELLIGADESAGCPVGISSCRRSLARSAEAKLQFEDTETRMREGVWTHGEDTGFEAWVGEKSRKVIITREAIEDYLRLDPVRAAEMSAEERRHFVIDDLAIMIAACARQR